MPKPNLTHLMRLTDDTGLLQHACYSVPRRSEGYASDDNARALVLVARLYADAPDKPLADLASRYLSFLEHAQDERGHFNNFMSYDRRWIDVEASMDCQGRCVWALAEVSRSPLPECLRETAWRMLWKSVEMPGLAACPRGTALYLMALEQAVAVDRHRRLLELARKAADRLIYWFEATADDSWQWFEDIVAYDAGRLPHGLLAAAATLDDPKALAVGRQALDFLARHTVRDGVLVPVGNNGWFRRGGAKADFDQQPIEVAATVEAALAAWRATGETAYADLARTANRWFLGDNCVGLPLADAARGSCCDGLQPRGVNRNEGAESTLSYLMAKQAMEKSGLSP